ncbi:MAG: MATE family efflux transporter [Candidatus Competibacter denitrificans]|jgi:MATE family multidrug resistance protein
MTELSLVPRLRTEIAAFLRVGGPLIAAQVAQMAMGFFDTLMVGRVGPVELAAVAIGTGLWHTLFLFALGILMALSPSVAHLHGAGQSGRIAPLVRQALWLALLLGIICFIALRHLEPLLVTFGIEPTIIPITSEYLHALSWGMFPVFVFMALRLFSEGIARTRPILLVSVLALAVNIVANYALIFGHWGFPAWGAFGCGVATALGMWAGLVTMLVILRVDDRYRFYALFQQWDWPNWRELRPLLILGLPIGIGLFLETGVFAAVALLLGTLGATAAAAHQVALNVAAMTFMVPLGLSMATTVRVGQALGRNDPRAARFSGLTGIGLCGLFMALMALAMALMRHEIAGWYTRDTAVAILAASLLQLAALFQISDGLQVGALGALRGLKDTRLPMLIVLVAYWVLAFPLGWLFGIRWQLGPAGPWIGLIIGLSSAAFLLNLRFWQLSARLARDNPGQPNKV